MNENISKEQYENEIYMLNRKLLNAEKKILELSKTDPYNPFKNPTEFRHYNHDYKNIEPEIKKNSFELPLEPEYNERRKLKNFYNITGMQIVFHIIASNFIMYLTSIIIITILQFMNPQSDYSSLMSYFNATISSPLNMLVFMICNILFGWLGLKMTRTSPAELIDTCSLTLSKIIAYLFIAFFIQYFSSVIISFIEEIMNQCGFNLYNINDYTDYQSTPSKISDVIYSIIVAPVTEEFFYRGMVLKNLSRASQRCGIFLSAIIFGLMHQTLPQIILGFIMGIFLAHITIKHNSIIPAIIVHSFNNSLSYIMSPLADITSEKGILIANSVYYTIVLFGLFALIAFKLTNSIPHDTPHQSKRGLSLAIKSVPIIIALIYYIFMTISYILKVS